MRKLSILAASAAALLIAGCSLDITVEETDALPDGLYPVSTFPESFVALLPQGNEVETKTSLTYSDGRLRTSWKAGDIVSVVPAGWSQYASLYKAAGNGSSAVFSRESGPDVVANAFLFFYPGDKIKNDYSYVGFSYAGQVQDKSDPMAHLDDLQAMRVMVEDFSSDNPSIDFSSADQSSCMRFSLSGMSFDTPSEIKLSVLRGNAAYRAFAATNALNSYWQDGSTGQGIPEVPMVSSLSLYLNGYGSAETSLTAFMMMSNIDVNLNAGDVVRVSVVCSDETYESEITLSSSMVLHGGHCHSLVLSSGWHVAGNPGGGVEPPDSTKYEYDGEPVILQQGTEEKLNIVLLGDGFINADFVDGTYDALMRKVYSSLFDIQPYTYFKDRFNVSYVKAVSPQRTYAINTGLNGAENTGTVTKFSTSFTPNSTSTSGDYTAAVDYAKYALGANANSLVNEAVIIVVANQRCHAGTCRMAYSGGNDYGSGTSIVFMGMGSDDDDLKGLIHHEALGHGFGKLADEYFYNSYYSYADQIKIWSDMNNTYHSYGMYRNVDIYVDQDYISTHPSTTYPLTTTSNVYWSRLFGTANNYETLEGLGIYEGAYTVCRDFCRPTDAGESCVMHSHGPEFNAPCRRQILYRLRHLSGEVSGSKWGDVAEELNPFLEWDATYYIPSVNSAPAAPARARKSKVEVDPMWSPPVLVCGRWVDGVFIEEKL